MTKKSPAQTTNVIQALTQLDGTPIMQSVHCSGCADVSAKIYKLLSPTARAEMDARLSEIDEITKSEPEELLLRFVLNRALLAGLKGDEFTPEQHFARNALARRIYDNDELVITAKEKAMFLERIAEAYNSSSLIAGQACGMVDLALGS